jgi:sodium/potassium-transporting ATPase subunit alpha
LEIITGGVETFRKKYPKVYEVPFNSTNKYAITINESRLENGHWICMKGAPERILEKCSTILSKGKEVSLDSKLKQQFQEAYEELGTLGERVIGLKSFQVFKQNKLKNSIQ